VPRCFVYLNRLIDVRLRALFIPSVHISFSIVYIGFLGTLPNSIYNLIGCVSSPCIGSKENTTPESCF
jgi:hypothetical protein